MIENPKPSLTLCVLGAGAVHAALLASVLPVMITLPAPADGARATVAVPVAVRTALPVPHASTAAVGPGLFSEVVLFGEGDADEIALPPALPVPLVHENLPVRNATTHELPLMRQAALSGPVTAPAPVPTVEPVATPGATPAESAGVSVIARLPDFMPDAVPYPKRKPAFTILKDAPIAAKRRAPTAKKRAPAAKKNARRTPSSASRRVTRTEAQQPKSLFGGIFSAPPKRKGPPGRAMPEFPLPAAR